MGRGLSELQKAILELTWKEYQIHHNAYKDKERLARWKAWDKENEKRYLLYAPDKPIPPTDLKPFLDDNWQGYAWIADIFVAYYHWTPQSISWRGRSKFSKSEIGIKPYMAAHIAVHKALKRLQARKLISFSGDLTSYYLTMPGQDLMVKLAE